MSSDGSTGAGSGAGSSAFGSSFFARELMNFIIEKITNAVRRNVITA